MSDPHIKPNFLHILAAVAVIWGLFVLSVISYEVLVNGSTNQLLHPLINVIGQVTSTGLGGIGGM